MKSQLKKKTMFLSFTSLLHAYGEGLVSHADLASGIFLFGCARAYAHDPLIQVSSPAYRNSWRKRHQKNYDVIRTHLLTAEKDGRACWRKDDYGRPIKNVMMLNYALVRVGYHDYQFDEWQPLDKLFPIWRHEETHEMVVGTDIPMNFIV